MGWGDDSGVFSGRSRTGVETEEGGEVDGRQGAIKNDRIYMMLFPTHGHSTDTGATLSLAIFFPESYIPFITRDVVPRANRQFFIP